METEHVEQKKPIKRIVPDKIAEVSQWKVADEENKAVDKDDKAVSEQDTAD